MRNTVWGMEVLFSFLVFVLFHKQQQHKPNERRQIQYQRQIYQPVMGSTFLSL